MSEPLLTRYMQPLLAGRRAECFELIRNALAEGHSAERIANDVVWPAMTQVDRLYRDDRIEAMLENMAARINRTVADQLQARLRRAERKGKRIIVVCATEPCEEIAGQMIADQFQASGWDAFLIGADVPNDELLKLVGDQRPHALLIYGTQPADVPAARHLVELIRDIGVCPTMNIVASGGVFNRVDGLWQEVGADVFADCPREIVQRVDALEPRIPGPRKMGIVKKRRRRRKAVA